MTPINWTSSSDDDQHKKYTIHRDTKNKKTYISEWIAKEYDRIFEQQEWKNYSYCVAVDKAIDDTCMLIEDFWEKDDSEFSKHTKNNKRNLTHTENILNVDWESIDRAAAHLLWWMTIDGLKYRHKTVDVWWSIDIDGEEHAIYYYRPAGYINANICWWHFSYWDASPSERAIQEIKEEIKLIFIQDNIDPVGVIGTPHELSKKESIDVVDRDFHCYHIKVNEDQLDQIIFEWSEISRLCFITTKDIEKLTRWEKVASKNYVRWNWFHSWWEISLENMNEHYKVFPEYLNTQSDFFNKNLLSAHS